MKLLTRHKLMQINLIKTQAQLYESLEEITGAERSVAILLARKFEAVNTRGENVVLTPIII